MLLTQSWKQGSMIQSTPLPLYKSSYEPSLWLMLYLYTHTWFLCYNLFFVCLLTLSSPPMQLCNFVNREKVIRIKQACQYNLYIQTNTKYTETILFSLLVYLQLFWCVTGKESDDWYFIKFDPDFGMLL